jgi:hypothetical protein
MTCAHSGSLPASAAAGPAIAMTDFDTTADFYEGLPSARRDHRDREDRGERVGLRLAAGSSAVALRPAVFARRVVSTINVTATDRPITCQFTIVAENGLWDLTYDARIFNPNDVPIASGTRWANDKPSFTGALSTTLTDPIVPGTYRCTIDWHAASDSTGESVFLPTATVPMTVTP